MGVWAAGSETLFQRSLRNLNRILQALGCKTFSWSRHCESAWSWVLWAVWNPFHFTPGYNVCQVQCALCYWILNPPWSISSAWEQALDHYPLALISGTEADIQTQQQTIPKLMSAFHPHPRPNSVSTFPQVMLLKRSDIKNGCHEGLPQRKHHLATHLHLWESALVQQQTKPLPHLRQTHWLP